MQHYNQVKAMFAITKASLRGQFRSPSAVLFSFAFPFIFILVFGFIGKNTGVPVFKIALSKNCDTVNALFDSIKKSSSIKIVSFPNDKPYWLNEDSTIMPCRSCFVKKKAGPITRLSAARP